MCVCAWEYLHPFKGANMRRENIFLSVIFDYTKKKNKYSFIAYCYVTYMYNPHSQCVPTYIDTRTPTHIHTYMYTITAALSL